MLQDSKYLIRKDLFWYGGGGFYVYSPNGNMVFHVGLKPNTSYIDLRFYLDKNMEIEALIIKARHIVPLSATFDVIDATTRENIGAVSRRGLKSFILSRPEWAFLNADGREVGSIRAQFFPMPTKRYFGEIGSRRVCKFKRTLNPFVSEWLLDFSADDSGLLDKRLGIAAATLIVGIEFFL